MDHILVIAPDNYPGKKYRDKYVYEHILVWWLNTGYMPKKTEIIHHKNENKHDNRFENLELKDNSEHCREHGYERGKPLNFICPICLNNFTLRTANYNKKVKAGNEKFYCSRLCQHESMKKSRHLVIK